jgi:hypothetical protein
MPEDELYSGRLLIRTPFWLLAGAYQALLTNDVYLHEVKIEDLGDAGRPMRYRLKIITPSWAVTLCRSISEDNGRPKSYIVHRLSAHRSSTHLTLEGEMYVGEKPILRTTVDYKELPDGVSCKYTGHSLQAKYKGLLGTAGSHIQKMLVTHQRDLEKRALAVLAAVMLTVRLLVR